MLEACAYGGTCPHLCRCMLEADEWPCSWRSRSLTKRAHIEEVCTHAQSAHAVSSCLPATVRAYAGTSLMRRCFFVNAHPHAIVARHRTCSAQPRHAALAYSTGLSFLHHRNQSESNATRTYHHSRQSPHPSHFPGPVGPRVCASQASARTVGLECL